MRAYKALLHVFPASFRAEYGEEMCAVFRRGLRECGGPVSRSALWAREIGGVLLNAVRVHADLLRQDLRYTGRTLARSPGFAATAIVVAGLGIAATTATFSITDHVLVRPLPFREPGRLVKLWQTQGAYSRTELSPAVYRDWKHRSTSFESMAAWRTLSTNLVGSGTPERLAGASVTPELFQALGASAVLGRIFSAEDDQEGAPKVLLLSHGLWQSRFGGDPAVLGKTVVLDDAAHVIVGVMPRSFHFPGRTDELWTSLRFAPDDFEDRDDCYLYAVARLGPGVTVDRARAELDTIAGQLAREYPKESEGMGASVIGLRDEVSRQARLLLKALVGAACCVLLIACTNLASLLLARALFRRRELAVRTALGAGRERLVRQLITESLVLAGCGGALGIVLALATTPLVTRLIPNSLPIAEAPGADLRTLLIATLATALTGLAFGVAPALRASRDVDASGLREGSRSGVGGRRERLRGLLVVTEVAVSVVLLVSSGLLIRALWRVQQVDPGFRSEGVLTLRTALPLPRYEKTATRSQFYARVLEGARALPGVSGAAYTTGLPMVARGQILGVLVPGRAEGNRAPTASARFVTPGFFAALQIPLRQGRDLSEADAWDTRPFAAVVSESFAREHWPGEDPLGRQFKFALQDRVVVGVVGDIRVRGLERDSEPQVYLSYRQMPDGGMIGHVPKDLVIRTSMDPDALVPAVRGIIAKADPQQPVSDVRTLADVVDAETAPRAVQVRVLGAFAAIAAVLAGIGIHGLLAFAVSNRQQEIGVRMTLGATRRDILHLVLGQGAVLAAAGVALGVALAYATGRTLEALLAGVSPRDAATFAAAVVLAVVMTILGSLFPALRASRVDPLVALRSE